MLQAIRNYAGRTMVFNSFEKLFVEGRSQIINSHKWVRIIFITLCKGIFVSKIIYTCIYNKDLRKQINFGLKNSLYMLGSI